MPRRVRRARAHPPPAAALDLARERSGRRERAPASSHGTVWSDYEEKEVIIENPALGLESVIFGSFSCISLDSIVDSIDSSQIPLLIGRGQRRRVEGAEEHPPRQLLPGWGSRGRAFNSGLASQMDRSCPRVEAPLPGDISSCGVPGGIVLAGTTAM